jgi:hypothetical protein
MINGVSYAVFDLFDVIDKVTEIHEEMLKLEEEEHNAEQGRHQPQREPLGG